MKKHHEHIRTHRINYSSGILDEKKVSKDPIMQFENWLQQAIEKGMPEPHAMVFSSVSKKGRPSSRVLLLREATQKGFVFYTNYKSRKGEEIKNNPWACITFFWQQLERQVRIEGKLDKLPAKKSDEYFQSRPFESRVGAWTSKQSETIKGRKELDKRYLSLLKKYKGKEVPRPENWGGYCLVPSSMEFWQGRPNRLHDRILFEKQKNKKSWKISRLSP